MAGEPRSKRSTPPPKVGLTPANFDRLVEDHGSYVRVTPSMVCPRRTGERVELDDNNHDLNCPLCFGSMTIDCSELSQESWAFIQSVKLDLSLESSGIFDVKDAFATFKPGFRISYWYKIELLDFATQYNEILMRNPDSDRDKLRYPAVIDTTGGNIFHVVDNDGNRFIRDDDYEVETGSREIIWSKNAPVKGRLYTMLYPVLPTFRVLEMMHETRNYYEDTKSPTRSPVNMPQQAHIRWDYMAAKQGVDRERN